MSNTFTPGEMVGWYESWFEDEWTNFGVVEPDPAQDGYIRVSALERICQATGESEWLGGEVQCLIRADVLFAVGG